MKLKSFFQIGIVLGLVVALVSGVLWLRSERSQAQVRAEQSQQEENLDEDTGPDARLDEDLTARQNPSPTPEKSRSEPVDPAKASEFFGQTLRQLSACLGVRSLSGADRVEPTVENLVNSVKGDFGEPILRSQDWVTWNIKVGGEERRIRVETDYSDSEETSTHLLYFKLDSQGQPTLIPLPSEQTRNPSEAFIASIQKDGEVYQEEKGERAYFENGQEMVLTERNGKVDDLEFSNGTKTFRCAGILTTNPGCKCY